MINQIHEITTERLYMRTLTEADAKIVKDNNSDEFETEEAALKWIKWVQNKNNEGRLIVNFYIWLTGTEQCIGRVYIHSKPELNGEVEIGYGISEEYRNKGYATAAVKIILRYGFHYLGLERISSSTQEENIGSQRVLEKCGFTLEGRERKAKYLAGKRHDMLIYGLLLGEYKLKEERE